MLLSLEEAAKRADLTLEELQQNIKEGRLATVANTCLLYTSPSPRDRTRSRMPSSA